MSNDFMAGIRAAAAFVAKRRDAYIEEHGSYDPSTGATEFPGDGDEYVGELEEIEEGILALPIPQPAPEPEAHPDDVAVDRFAAAMKAKLAKKRDEGRGGWEVPNKAIQMVLSLMLREDVEKGDPVDVANLAMMLHQRGEPIHPASATGIRRNYSPEVPTNGSGGQLPPPSDD